MIIDNGKFIITNEVIVDKYDIRIQNDFGGVPAIVQISKADVGVIFIGGYQNFKFFIDGNKLVAVDNNFYGEFSANNTDSFTTAQDLLLQLKSQIN
jgi:hypothetical protein